MCGGRSGISGWEIAKRGRGLEVGGIWLNPPDRIFAEAGQSEKILRVGNKEFD